MSGLEVASLVLGAFPLLGMVDSRLYIRARLTIAVSALEHYADGLETIGRWWRYKRSSVHLASMLDGEWGHFQGCAERLLDGLVAGTELNYLIEHSGGPLWQNKDLDKKLKRRLGRDHRRVFRCIVAMNEAINKLWRRLELDEDGKVCSLPSLKDLTNTKG